MDSKEFPTISITCILCCRIDDQNSHFHEIDKKQMPNSKKTVKSVLMHLSKCIKQDYDFDFYASVCSSCFEKLAKYDEIMVQLLTHQKELGNMLVESMKTFNAENESSLNYTIEMVTEELDDDTASIKEETASVSSLNCDEDEAISGNDLSQDCKKLSFECNICDSRFKSKRALQIHLKTHVKLVSCTICGAARKDEEYLELHMNIHEGKTENECRYCPKKYSRRSHVIRHMHVHWDKKKFQCEKCGIRFSQANVLYNHKMNHEAEEDPIICNVCNQSFKSKRTFKHHMITHQEDRPMYPCKICGKVFTQKYTIKAHLKTHTLGYQDFPNSIKKTKPSTKKTKEFSCIICDKVMGTKESLDVHMSQEHDVITNLEEKIFN